MALTSLSTLKYWKLLRIFFYSSIGDLIESCQDLCNYRPLQRLSNASSIFRFTNSISPLRFYKSNPGKENNFPSTWWIKRIIVVPSRAPNEFDLFLINILKCVEQECRRNSRCQEFISYFVRCNIEGQNTKTEKINILKYSVDWGLLTWNDFYFVVFFWGKNALQAQPEKKPKSWYIVSHLRATSSNKMLVN